MPGELRSGLIHKDWPIFIPVGGRTSYLGDVLAMVVADDRPTARHAATLIDVTYDVLTPMTNPPRRSPRAKTRCGSSTATCCRPSTYARGDADDALGSRHHVVRETFQTQRIDHAFLEPESTLAVPVPAGSRCR